MYNTLAAVLQDRLIFGIKTGQCKFNEELENVDLLHEIFEALGKLYEVENIHVLRFIFLKPSGPFM